MTGDLAGDFRFNTAVAALMETLNEVLDVWSDRREGLDAGQWRTIVETCTLLLAPMTPHIAEEIWQRLGHDGRCSTRRGRGGTRRSPPTR